jgi:hypothetical protein
MFHISLQHNANVTFHIPGGAALAEVSICYGQHR